MVGKTGRGQGRGFFLKERKPGSLGTEKARVPPSLLMASCPLLLLQPTPGMGITGTLLFPTTRTGQGQGGKG